MVEALKWLAFTIPVGAIALGSVWAFGQQSLSAIGEQVRKLDPPPGVALTSDVRHAIGTELYRRRRLGTRASMVVAALGVVALHPMYALEQLAHGTLFAASIVGGLLIGETYAATHAVRSRGGRRIAMLHPRDSSTYLSAAQRVAQLVLPTTVAVATVALLVEVGASSAEWVESAAFGCAVWLVLICALLIAQRWVRAQPPPVRDEREVIVREYVTAAAIQQLHKAIWATGALVYLAAFGYMLDGDFTSMMLTVGPPVAIWMVVVGYRRWRQLPDPVWHFARTTGSPA